MNADPSHGTFCCRRCNDRYTKGTYPRKRPGTQCEKVWADQNATRAEIEIPPSNVVAAPDPDVENDDNMGMAPAVPSLSESDDDAQHMAPAVPAPVFRRPTPKSGLRLVKAMQLRRLIKKAMLPKAEVHAQKPVPKPLACSPPRQLRKAIKKPKAKVHAQKLVPKPPTYPPPTVPGVAPTYPPPPPPPRTQKRVPMPPICPPPVVVLRDKLRRSKATLDLRVRSCGSQAATEWHVGTQAATTWPVGSPADTTWEGGADR